MASSSWLTLSPTTTTFRIGNKGQDIIPGINQLEEINIILCTRIVLGVIRGIRRDERECLHNSARTRASSSGASAPDKRNQMRIHVGVGVMLVAR